jgi:hypothetical protein
MAEDTSGSTFLKGCSKIVNDRRTKEKTYYDKNGRVYRKGIYLWNKEKKEYEEFFEGTPEYEVASKEMLLINLGRKRKREK